MRDGAKDPDIASLIRATAAALSDVVVIARSEATKQSIYPRTEIWIASRSLSSGAHSRDPVARNDVEAPVATAPAAVPGFPIR
ncbi:MAG TPA: hypothetical protein VMT08_14780, partial [Bradyrhizobium sp.]|nr:hypothetical protein [Bradyrhizobium sp.]